MTKGKVVLVPFPFDDLSGTKARPALCLTDPIGPHRHVVLAFITSRAQAELLDTDFYWTQPTLILPPQGCAYPPRSGYIA